MTGTSAVARGRINTRNPGVTRIVRAPRRCPRTPSRRRLSTRLLRDTPRRLSLRCRRQRTWLTHRTRRCSWRTRLYEHTPVFPRAFVPGRTRAAREPAVRVHARSQHIAPAVRRGTLVDINTRLPITRVPGRTRAARKPLPWGRHVRAQHARCGTANLAHLRPRRRTWKIDQTGRRAGVPSGTRAARRQPAAARRRALHEGVASSVFNETRVRGARLAVAYLAWGTRAAGPC